MGFFDKIKQAANFVTGNSAEVSLEVENPSMDGPFMVHIRARIKDADVNARKIYLKVRDVEEVIAPDVDLARDNNGQVRTVREDVHHSQVLTETEFEVSGPQELEGNGEYDWSIEVSLPERANGSYYGQNAKHMWQFFAGIDKSGNDPDSGWVEVEIY